MAARHRGQHKSKLQQHAQTHTDAHDDAGGGGGGIIAAMLRRRRRVRTRDAPSRKRRCVMAVVAMTAVVLVSLSLLALVAWQLDTARRLRRRARDTTAMTATATDDDVAASLAAMTTTTTTLCDGGVLRPLRQRNATATHVYEHTRALASAYLHTDARDDDEGSSSGHGDTTTHAAATTTTTMRLAAARLLDAAAYAHPPLLQAALSRDELNRLLRYGARVPGTPRDGVLRHLLREGLGARHDWRDDTRHSCNDNDDNDDDALPDYATCLRVTIAANTTASPACRVPAHLTPLGACLLRQRSRRQERRQRRQQQPEDEHTAAFARADERGWWWDVQLDSFREQVPQPQNNDNDNDNNNGDGAAAASTRAVDFSNIVFSFAGGSRTRAAAATAASNTARHDKLATSSPPPPQPPPRHIVFAAHWDTARLPSSSSPSSPPFVGACDSAVPVLMLLRLMKSVAVLTDVAEAVAALYVAEASRHSNNSNNNKSERKNSSDDDDDDVAFASRDDDDVWSHVRRVVAPAHAYLLHDYYFATATSSARHTPRNPSNDAAAAHAAVDHDDVVVDDVRVWLDRVRRLPAITVALFDGEEAMVAWRGDDNTYGSRHLAARWRRECVAWRRDDDDNNNNNDNDKNKTATRVCAQSRYDTVDLFVLLDLLGPSTTRLRNFFPAQSGAHYAALRQHERALRARTRLVGDALCRTPSSSLPPLWRALGAPTEFFAYARRRDGVENGDADETTYFAASEAARAPHSAAQPTPDDDHKHWLATRRVLMLTALPFPHAWHTTRDDAGNIDDGVVVDLNALLLRFALSLPTRAA